MKKDNKIGFKFIGIKTEQFAIFEENYQSTNSPNFQMGLEFKMNEDEKTIGCFTSFTFDIRKKPFIKIETSCSFRILDKFWDKFKSDNDVIIPKGFAQHLTAISVSSARGVLHAKTEDTRFNKFFLPLINIENVIGEDIKFKLLENA